MKVSSCPSCGAPIGPGVDRCPYCRQYIIGERPEERRTSVAPAEIPRGAHPPGAPRPPALGPIALRRQPEPNEGAFTVLVPDGWLVQGGIMRADLMHQAVDAQSIEAKLDLTIKRDSEGSVLIRWCPEIKYCDPRSSMAGVMGIFGMGAGPAGMLNCPVMTAQEFLIRMVFPWAHPAASAIDVAAQCSEPLLVERYRRTMAALGLPANFSYDGGQVTFQYAEGRLRFKETAQAVIESMGVAAAGMWSNKDTVLLRAPMEEYELWEPILRAIQESVEINFQWLAYEAVSQEFLSRSFLNAQQAAQARERRMLEIQQQLTQMDRQITEHRMRTNAEIHNDAYLTLMELEEYVNPYTGEPETGSNQWNYRWTTEDGAVFYTDSEDDNPNVEALLNYSDWRRTPIRPRFPQ